jgi:hypothetical protein
MNTRPLTMDVVTEPVANIVTGAQYIVHNFSRTIDINYVIFENKSTAARETIVRSWMPNNSEIRLTGKAGFDKIYV